MNRQQAVELLHERHPHVIEAPGGRIVEMLELYWFQRHVCKLMEERCERSLKRCFATVHRILIEGEHDVLHAICGYFFSPYLIYRPELAWAKQWMPPLLASLCSRIEQDIPSGPLAPDPDDRSGGG